VRHSINVIALVSPTHCRHDSQTTKRIVGRSRSPNYSHFERLPDGAIPEMCRIRRIGKIQRCREESLFPPDCSYAC
jgi:hypothetical protein